LETANSIKRMSLKLKRKCTVVPYGGDGGRSEEAETVKAKTLRDLCVRERERTKPKLPVEDIRH